MSRLNSWWTQSDQFEWITTFLRQRGFLRPARVIMAVVAGSSMPVPLSVVAFQDHLSVGGAVAGGLAVVFTIAMAIFWLTRWPTRRQSQVTVVSGVLIIAGWSLIQPSASLAALACTATAVTGGYIAFFHGPKMLLFNVSVALAIATSAVWRLAHGAHIAAAATSFWLIVFLNLSVALSISGMSRAMGMYVQRSEQDHLTGLLNRRAFSDAVSICLANPPSPHTHLAVVMIDLDDFKRINDTYGHSVGDGALRAVAHLLREQTPAGAVICRAGGEEFLVALTCVISDVQPLAARFCTAVARLSPGFTASIGTASAALELVHVPDAKNFLDELVGVADSAMYAAKRRGGNQAQHSSTASAIGGASISQDPSDQWRDVRVSLGSREAIEQAIGIIRAQSGGSSEEALDWLREISRSENVKPGVVAQRLIDDAARQARARHHSR